MRLQSFYGYLTQELQSARFALLAAYEAKDKLLYIEAPPLRQEYMDKIGGQEEPVLEAELEIAMLRRKVELLQAAVNRRETVDLEQLEAQLVAEKEERLADLETADRTLEELPRLSEEDQHTLQRIYRDVIDEFHPGLHPDLTDTQRELYEKAMDAYRRQDVEAMKLVNEMLHDGGGAGVSFSFGLDDSPATPEELRAGYRELATQLATDYALAKELYPCFAPLEVDAVVLNAIGSYTAQREQIMAEMETIRAQFPFNAKETLTDSQKVEDYLAELRIRRRRCDTEKQELEARIAKLTEGMGHG